MSENVITTLGVVVLLLVLIWLVPWLTIWAVNGLFGTGIEQSLVNWAYVWVIKLVGLNSASWRRS